MIDALSASPELAALFAIGWQEILTLGCCPLFTVAIVFTVLYFTGVIGGRGKK